MNRILVVDDEVDLRETIADVLRRDGHEVATAATGFEAIAEQERRGTDTAVLDLALPDMSGLDLFVRLRQADRHLPVIIVTGHATVRSAVELMKAGAYDYVTKPFDNDDLRMRVERALEHRRLTSRLMELEGEIEARTVFSEIVGRSPAIQEVLKRLARVARMNMAVLLSGESGTGKELAARGLHHASPRAAAPFVPVNCGAIPESLAETELFGHTRGAFTDATGERKGCFERAHGGTLFLDEIGDLPLNLQVKLLRVLEEHRVFRVGAEQPVAVDIRLVAATHKDLSKEVAEGRFRDDLFWRLNVFNIEMPPLRDRRDDVALLVGRLLQVVNAECRTEVSGVVPAVLARFQDHPWPGNVRELANVLRQAVVMSDGQVLQVEDLPDYLLNATTSPGVTPDTIREMGLAMAAAERQLLTATLERFKGNRTAAAEALGITRRTVSRKLRP